MNLNSSLRRISPPGSGKPQPHIARVQGLLYGEASEVTGGTPVPPDIGPVPDLLYGDASEVTGGTPVPPHIGRALGLLYGD